MLVATKTPLLCPLCEGDESTKSFCTACDGKGIVYELKHINRTEEEEESEHRRELEKKQLEIEKIDAIRKMYEAYSVAYPVYNNYPNWNPPNMGTAIPNGYCSPQITWTGSTSAGQTATNTYRKSNPQNVMYSTAQPYNLYSGFNEIDEACINELTTEELECLTSNKKQEEN